MPSPFYVMLVNFLSSLKPQVPIIAIAWLLCIQVLPTVSAIYQQENFFCAINAKVISNKTLLVLKTRPQ